MKRTIFLILICIFEHSFVYGMIGTKDIETLCIEQAKSLVQAALTYQLFLTQAQLKMDSLKQDSTVMLNLLFFHDSRINEMKFNKLVPNNNSFTLPNLFIEELVNPSAVNEEYGTVVLKKSPIAKGNNSAMRKWLRQFYTIIAPTLCCILNPAYDFSDTFKMYMPKTYHAVTQKQSEIKGNASITKKLNIQNIDDIVANEYTKKLSAATGKS